MKERFELNGYAFQNKAEWEEGKRELEEISYIRAKMDMSDPAKLQKLYQGLVDKKTFVTPLGIDFLKELREELQRTGILKTEELAAIPVQLAKKKSHRVDELAEVQGNKQRLLTEYYKEKLKNARIVTFVLILLVGIMFLFTMLGPSSPFIDAEIKLQNKYAAWEQELTERENTIRQREQELQLDRKLTDPGEM